MVLAWRLSGADRILLGLVPFSIACRQGKNWLIDRWVEWKGLLLRRQALFLHASFSVWSLAYDVWLCSHILPTACRNLACQVGFHHCH